MSATHASSSISKMEDEVQLMVVSTAVSRLQRIIRVPKGLGETSSPEIAPRSSNCSKLLDVHPLELRFPFEPKKLITCPVNLTNTTDHFIGVWIRLTGPDTDTGFRFPFPLFLEKSWKDRPSHIFQIVSPHYTRVVVITLKEQEHLPPHGTHKFELLMIIMGSKHNLQTLKSFVDKSYPNTNTSFLLKRAKELGGDVHRDMLTAVICGPENNQAAVTHQTISSGEFGAISSIDAHPTKTWILMGHEGGYVSIWNYETREIVMAMQVTRKSGMLYFLTNTSKLASCSAKFIAREQWFATGDGDGYLHVYDYTTTDKIKEFQAHRHKVVDSLAIHPTQPFLLSSSSSDMMIKLWD
ncbi:hypothetical protein EJB05_36895, partial [Eragrostis curvula]